ncbi:MAG: diaminopimelate epimerase [Actinobacteria bacterium]|nr:diaminopimelate epimerase [Actinomycetota bacterium]MCL5887594.1 diaminopimelate epimerase [Actinomycetota bacterium]
MLLEFTKMHGLGNDFIIVNDLDAVLDLPANKIAQLCDRHFGVGADGMIFVRPATESGAHAYMHYYNADGSQAEMCGNGIRCFAKYLIDKELVPPGTPKLYVQTLGGVRSIDVQIDECGTMSSATVDMGEPKLAPSDIPSTFEGDIVFQRSVETSEGSFDVTAVSMGNPHAVIWVDDLDAAPVLTVGPLIESHDSFPAKTNVEFAQILDPTRIRLRVWERGVGETQACGTGACATVVAAVLASATDERVVVELPGGELLIEWQQGGAVFMTGPATHVFEGRVR